ncbi:MAG: helix-turn-helix domain-containing protein [Mycobacteriaceae bacterium]|nr:helix-turn-helix domain-containing protein [Mycobacteriaceae bacterium]
MTIDESNRITTITRLCQELAEGMLGGADVSAMVRRFEDTVAHWAQAGVPFDALHHGIHDGVRRGIELVGTAKLVVDLLDMMTATASVAYRREQHSASADHGTVATLAAALLAGRPTSALSRECGVDVAARYHVLAVAIPPHSEEAGPGVDRTVAAHRRLRRVQTALAESMPAALPQLGVEGGTALVPADAVSADHLIELDGLVAQLSQAAKDPVTATAVTADACDIPAAADQAHQLLDMVQRLEMAGGLHGFDSLAHEYQLTRPGPGRERLCTLLDPLDGHPDLLATLQRHIANDLNRRRTARVLHIHTNTLDYRLKRIGALTGFDPTHPGGMWYLRSALVARSYRHPPAPRQARLRA